MSISDLRFLFIFGVVVFCVWLIRRFSKDRNKTVVLLLLLISYIFMSSNNIYFAIILFVYSISVYLITYLLSHAKKKRFVIILIGNIASLAMLGYFKYFNFFAESFGKNWGENIIVPLGISFYVFSAMSYMLDVYWEIIEARKSIFDVLLYICFFPKIVAGPIITAASFFSELDEKRPITRARIIYGLQLIIIGLFKKIVIADHIGVVVNAIFDAPNQFSGLTLLFCGALGYAMQLYFDFSGYSEIAIGMMKMLGIDVDNNFNLPYFVSKGVTDFWRRWHISLGTWFRMYLMYPVMKSRWMSKIRDCSKQKWGKTVSQKLTTILGMVCVWFFTGLWHGANWTYLLWGIYYFFVMLVEFLTGCNKRNVAYFYTPFIVIVGYILFRSTSVSQALFIGYRILSLADGVSYFSIWILVAIVYIFFEIILSKHKLESTSINSLEVDISYPITDLRKLGDIIFFLVFAGLIIVFGYFGDSAFIYAQF